MSLSFSLPLWYDLHAHFRQGKAMGDYIRAHREMGCAGILAMPNTKPPVSRVTGENTDTDWSIESYLSDLRRAGGHEFEDIIVPLYLTRNTTPAMIEEGAASGLLRAAKYYPPHGTTNADHGLAIENFIDNGVFAAMEKCGVVLCVHGEEHDLSGAAYFDRDSNAEDVFYKNRLPTVVSTFPRLKVVCEHITTKTAVDFVLSCENTVVATVTPQHLLYTVGHLVQGFKYHLYCLPLVKFESDRSALRRAVTDPKNTKFFAGTDSAPHTAKATPCGCAAGCFTGGIAPQLYAKAFEEAGIDLSATNGQGIFRQFLCDNGVAFYGLPPTAATFTLLRKKMPVVPLSIDHESVIPLPLGLGENYLEWSIER